MNGLDHAPPTPAPDLRSRVDGAAVNNLDAEKKTRLFPALSEDLFIYPLDPSTYQVLSLKDDGDHSEYTVSVFHRPICECHDYIFQCIGSEQWCKHIFRVWAEVHVGDLPPLGIDPDRWLQSRLESTLFDLIESPDETEEAAKEVREAHGALESDPGEDAFATATNIWRRNRLTDPTP